MRQENIPVQPKTLPYGRQWLDESDITAVVEVLSSDWLTTGPKVTEFEQTFAQFIGVDEAVAVSSGTAAMHAAMHAINIVPGDEVIVPAITFVATANAVVFEGGTPVFCDIDPSTLLIDPKCLEKKITSRTRAIVAVDYAGQPCDYDALRSIAAEHKLVLIADACHSLGGQYKGKHVGTLADITAFSFHPVKPITTGEGGMVVTNNANYAEIVRRFRNHGITTDHRQREKEGTWQYEMIELGFNYRLTDLQAALGISQLKRLSQWTARRQAIANHYNKSFASLSAISPLKNSLDVSHAYHLYVIQLEKQLGKDRASFYSELRSHGIGVNVHYLPVYLHPFYQEHFHTAAGLCPEAESAYERILSLPIFPRMSEEEISAVVDALTSVAKFE